MRLLINYGTLECGSNEDDGDEHRLELDEQFKEEITRVGSVVYECLKQAGLECEWDGDWKKRIAVLSLPDTVEPKPSSKLSTQEPLSLLAEMSLPFFSRN